MRKEFEEWYSDNGQWPQAIERRGDGYKLAQAQSSWVAWQASWGKAYIAGYNDGHVGNIPKHDLLNLTV